MLHDSSTLDQPLIQPVSDLGNENNRQIAQPSNNLEDVENPPVADIIPVAVATNFVRRVRERVENNSNNIFGLLILFGAISVMGTIIEAAELKFSEAIISASFAAICLPSGIYCACRYGLQEEENNDEIVIQREPAQQAEIVAQQAVAVVHGPAAAENHDIENQNFAVAQENHREPVSAPASTVAVREAAFQLMQKNPLQTLG